MERPLIKGNKIVLISLAFFSPKIHLKKYALLTRLRQENNKNRHESIISNAFI